MQGWAQEDMELHGALARSHDLLRISIIIQIQVFRLYDGHPVKLNCDYEMYQMPVPASDTSSFRW